MFFIACSKEIKNGPYVYFANQSELPDTINTATDSIVTFEISAIGNGYKVNRIQLFVNQSEYYDTTFDGIDSILVSYDMNFKGKLRTQNVLIQATDEKEMIATQTTSIFAK